MGGTLDLEATGDAGSTFCLALPARSPDARDSADPMPQFSPAEPSMPAG